MSTVPTSPPAGWYPAPDGSGATWWWDGARWAQPGQFVTSQPPRTDGLRKLAVATQVLLIICGVMSLATIGLEIFGLGAVGIALDGNVAAFDLLTGYDQISILINVAAIAALIATGVVWVIWQFRAAKIAAGQTRRSPGWHVGSWFIPIVTLWFPYQNISDLWKAIGRSRPGWLIVWWLCWLFSSFFIQVSGRVWTIAEDLELFRVAMTASIVGEVLLLAAAPFAWLIVRDITRGMVQRSAGLRPSVAYA